MKKELYIGLMTGTSMDGIDGMLAAFTEDGTYSHTVSTVSIEYPKSLRDIFMQLQQPSHDEIAKEALAANSLAHAYADVVRSLLDKGSITADKVRAIGAHGQTIRHRPELGFTRQTVNNALLAELTGIDVIGDFRSRDVAAGGQGAPLVPACHAALFSAPGEVRVVVNIGGISNISVVSEERVIGFDTGPGNILMDSWISRHLGSAYDDNGAWAASGKVNEELLVAMLTETYFRDIPPKSTGRDLFHLRWLGQKLYGFADLAPADVQATLLELTAVSITNDIKQYAPTVSSVYICGGGAFNGKLLERIQFHLFSLPSNPKVQTTSILGISPQQVESLAFAWLAQCFVLKQAGNLPAVTGAKGPRILGALYPG